LGDLVEFKFFGGVIAAAPKEENSFQGSVTGGKDSLVED